MPAQTSKIQDKSGPKTQPQCGTTSTTSDLPSPETESSFFLKFSHLLSGLLLLLPRQLHFLQPPTTHPEHHIMPHFQPPQTLQCYCPLTVPPLAIGAEYKNIFPQESISEKCPYMHTQGHRAVRQHLLHIWKPAFALLYSELDNVLSIPFFSH